MIAARLRALAVLVMLAASAAVQADEIPVRWLSGQWIQGGVIIGQVEPGSTMIFEGRKLRLDSQVCIGTKARLCA